MSLIELCAGTGAVSLAALGCSRFPVSRIGSKAGWVGPILEALEVRSPIGAATLVEADQRLAELLSALLCDHTRAAIADAVEGSLAEPSRSVWERARSGRTPTKTSTCHPVHHPERFSLTLADGDHEEREIDLPEEAWRRRSPGEWMCIERNPCVHPHDDAVSR